DLSRRARCRAGGAGVGRTCSWRRVGGRAPPFLGQPGSGDHHIGLRGAPLFRGHGVGPLQYRQRSDGPETGALNRGRGEATMRHMRVHTLVSASMLALLVALGTAGVAFAHGERAQEGFLRMKTVAWEDVKFSSESVKQGEQLIITGKVKVLESWPATLEKPQEG